MPYASAYLLTDTVLRNYLIRENYSAPLLLFLGAVYDRKAGLPGLD